MTPTGRATPLSPDLRRETLIDATIALLRDHGASVTTRQISEACGVAEGTIFRAFPDKDSLITAALDKALDPAETIAEIAAVDRTLPLEPRLRAAGAVLYRRMTEVFSLRDVMHMRMQQQRSAAHATAEAHRARTGEIIDALADLLRPDEKLLRRTPAEVAQLLRALTFSGAHPLISADAPLSSDEVVSILLDGVRRHEKEETC